MTSACWTPDQARVLRELMLQKGVNEFQLAQLGTLSVRQVQVLMQDAATSPASCFYTEKIKQQAGQRLLNKLADLSA